METEVFVARQPIVDRRGAVVAQELLFRDSGASAANVRDGFTCSAAVVEGVLGAFGLEQVLDSGDGYLNCTGEFLFSGLLDVLPASRFVLEVLEDTELTPDLGARCDVLRQAGFRIALDDVRAITPAFERFLPHVDIVKLDWPYMAADEIADVIASCRRAGKRVLAEKVEERPDHAAAMQAGCDLFQGFYFARPQLLATTKAPSSLGDVFRVLQLLTEEASDAHLEQALRNVPALVVQLLRLANSGSRLRSYNTPITSITSIRQALSFVGSRQLMQWCCLLLYGTSPESDRSSERDPLVQLVERRSGFMERAAKESTPDDRNFHQSAWLTGLLSLVHIPHGVDVATFVNGLPIGPTIREAIIERRGALGHLLSIAEDLEAGSFDTAVHQSCALGPAFAAKLPVLAL